MQKIYGEDLKMFVNKGDAGHTNERKYIIDARWWRKWCDYTGLEIENTNQSPSKQSLSDDETVVFSCDKLKPNMKENLQEPNKSGKALTAKRYKHMIKKVAPKGKIEMLD